MVESERPITHKIPYVAEINFMDGKPWLELDVRPGRSLGQSEHPFPEALLRSIERQ